MKAPDIKKIYKEHQNALMLCDDIDHFVKHIDDNDNRLYLLEAIEDLRFLLINVHCPAEKQLTSLIESTAKIISLQSVCPGDRHYESINALIHLNELIDTAMKGSIVSKQDISDTARETINSIHRLVELEERTCLPYSKKTQVTSVAPDTDIFNV